MLLHTIMYVFPIKNQTKAFLSKQIAFFNKKNSILEIINLDFFEIQYNNNIFKFYLQILH